MELVFLLATAVIAALFVFRRNPSKPPYEKQAPSPAPKQNQNTTAPAKSPPFPRQPADTSGATPPPIPASRTLRGRAHVIDGDTLVVQNTKIRLAGIDAPELDQPWGQKSKWEMVRICKGEILDVKLTGETSYDRLIGTCYLSDGRDVGAEIVRSGLAIDGGHYSKGKYRHLEQPGMRAKLIRYGHRGRGNSKK